MGKLTALFSTALLALSWAECICKCASLIFDSFNDVPSLVLVDPKYLNGSISSNTLTFIHILDCGWPWLDAADEDLAVKM